MTLAYLHDLRDEIVFCVTMACGIFAVGFALGESNMANRLRADAECPAGEVFRRTVHLDGQTVTVKCDYYRTTTAARP